MEEWKTYKLSEIGTIVGGATPSTKVAENYDGDIPWITPKDLSSFSGRFIEHGERNITQRGFDSCSCQMLPKNSVLFSSRAPIGYVAIAAVPLCTNQGFKSVVPNEEIVDPRFLYYLLKFNKDRIAEMGSGTTFMEVSGGVMKNVEVSLPELMVQEHIADVLSSIDEKIELNNRINHNLEEQAQALYKSWFVDFEPFRDGKFIDSEFGLIPDGWHIGNISEMISDTYNGDWGKEESTGAFTKRVFCIRGADIPSIRVGSSGKMPTRFIQEKHFLSKYLKNDDLVIEISGGSPTQSTGRFCRITSDLIERYDHSLICTNFCKAIRPIEGCSLFLSYLWNDLYEKGTMFSYENGTTGIKNLDLSGLIMGEPVIIPDKRSMQLFSYAVSALNKQILFNGHENEKLGEQRDLMLPKLMSGEMISNNDVC